MNKKSHLFQSAMAIADVELRISSVVPLTTAVAPRYVPFLRGDAGRAKSTSRIAVDVQTTPAPANDSGVVFSGADVWTMQHEDEGYRLSFHWYGEKKPQVIVRADATTTRVVVHLSRLSPRRDSEGRGPSSEYPTDPLSYPVDQLLMMNHLAYEGGVIMHAAGMIMNGRGVVMPGVSGAGKSTISRLLADSGLGELLSDDRMIVRRNKDSIHGKRTDGMPSFDAWGTPWAGDAQIALNQGAPLAALLFLVQDEVDALVELGASEAMRRLSPAMTCPWYDAQRLPAVLDTCARIVEHVPCYDLHFRPGLGVVALLRDHDWG